VQDGDDVEMLDKLLGVRLLGVGEQLQSCGEEGRFLEKGLLEGAMRLEGGLGGG